MPTAKPRVQVTLTKASFRALSTLAKRHSRSMSGLAGEMLNDMLPLMEQALAVAAELRKLSPEEQLAKKSQLDMWGGEGIARLNGLTGVQRDDFALAEVQVQGPAPGEDARARPTGRRSRPPRTNRGV